MIPPDLSFYKYNELNVQDDGASCGFWAFLFGFLAVYGLDAEIVKAELRKANISHYKPMLKNIWTSWRIGEFGMERGAATPLLNEFFMADDLEKGKAEWLRAATVSAILTRRAE